MTARNFIVIGTGFVVLSFLLSLFVSGYGNDFTDVFALTTAPTIDVCVGHGGVDCAVLKPDASVTCKDGTKDDSLPFIYAVPQCQEEIELLTQQQADFMTTSGCFPPSEMGCMNSQSYNSVLERLRAQGLENSELGKNELNKCGQQIQEFRSLNAEFQSCLVDNNNPNFSLPGNRLVQPILKAVFCPLFYGYSTYNSETDTCLCDNGYFLFGERCVEANMACKSKYDANYYAQNGNCVALKPPSAQPSPLPGKTPSSSPIKTPDSVFISPSSSRPTGLFPAPLISPTISAQETTDPQKAPPVSSGNFVVSIFNKILLIIKKIF
ncbi:MAG: hypothetical protein WD989_02500 [Candidatus Paceibacterota bacterium]